MNKGAALTVSNYRDVISALTLLRRFLHARTGDPLLSTEDVAPLEALVREQSYFSADVPRILLMGRFKAGKSTLINSLVGANVAATDIFEMTSWVARYWPAHEPFCR